MARSRKSTIVAASRINAVMLRLGRGSFMWSAALLFVYSRRNWSGELGIAAADRGRVHYEYYRSVLGLSKD